MAIFLIVYKLLTSIATNEDLRHEDYIYNSQIKTVRVFPAGEYPEIKNLPSVTALDGSPLQVEFDDLQSDRVNYYAKIISCNYDWSKSNLHDLDFLTVYNEFNINQYEYSSNTLIPYVHYKFFIPEVKIPGNYLLVVYKDGNLDDLAFSKRFMVYSGAVAVTHELNYGMGSFKATNQQISFSLSYGGVDIPNPLGTVNVVIRQNQRWDNLQKGIKPSFIREANKVLEYRFFNSDNGFKGGNEFRFVDFTSLNYPGQNTGKLERQKSDIRLWVAIDAPRSGQRYAQYRDIDGGYIILNKDAGDGESTSNYLNVNFTLQSAHKYESDIYVIGAFNNWNFGDENKMEFSDGFYQCEILMKQGFYNYLYAQADKSGDMEGSFFETENQYEIFVYNKSIYPSADLLVGYYTFGVNTR